MPIENEIKYILSPNIMKETTIPDSALNIHQSYLPVSGGVTCRLRSVIDIGCNETFFLTIKTKNQDGSNTEVEVPLIKDDYLALVKKCDRHLYKIRIIYNDWVIDSIKDKDGNAVYLAEVEMPPGHDKPETIPEFIKRNILIEVDKNDDTYSNYNLAHKGYFKEVADSIKYRKSLIGNK